MILTNKKLLQQEENNNVNSQNDQNLNNNNSQKNSHVMLEMRSTAIKFTIAAANPLLAEKLSTPSGQAQLNNSIGSSNNRPQIAPLTPKIEKGK